MADSTGLFAFSPYLNQFGALTNCLRVLDSTPGSTTVHADLGMAWLVSMLALSRSAIREPDMSAAFNWILRCHLSRYMGIYNQ
jgi:hypothetical protein